MKHLPLLSDSARGSPKSSMMFWGLVILALALAGCGATAPTPTVQPTAAPTVAAPTDVAPTAVPAPASSQSITVNVKNFAFDPKELTVSVGTTVIWHNNDSVGHTVTSDTALFDGALPSGADFQFTFSQAGTYPYYCQPHGGSGGQGMSGVVVVK